MSINSQVSLNTHAHITLHILHAHMRNALSCRQHSHCFSYNNGWHARESTICYLAGWDNLLQQCSEIFYCTYGGQTKGNMCQLHSPGCRESSIYHILWLHICHTLNLIKIEWVLSRDGTIETCLHKSGPIVLEHQLSTIVILTNAGNARVYYLKHNAHNMHFSHVILITCYTCIHLHKAKLSKSIWLSPKPPYSHLLSNGTNEIKCNHNG